MPRIVLDGLIQAATPLTDPAAPIAEVTEAALAAQIPLIHEAGRRGVQILGFQEVFNGPYFCPSQDPHWYDIAEPAPGPTTERIAAIGRQYPEMDLDMIEQVRRVWQFYRDRRPETYGPMAEQRP
jgi:beta-ureidopropionase